eukprot:9033724-Pyramimonas_sp.AAC.1
MVGSPFSPTPWYAAKLVMRETVEIGSDCPPSPFCASTVSQPALVLAYVECRQGAHFFHCRPERGQPAE